MLDFLAAASADLGMVPHSTVFVLKHAAVICSMRDQCKGAGFLVAATADLSSIPGVTTFVI